MQGDTDTIKTIIVACCRDRQDLRSHDKAKITKAIIYMTTSYWTIHGSVAAASELVSGSEENHMDYLTKNVDYFSLRV